jgi:site-specific DNA-methyltransferase (adenine-specific)
MKNQFGLVAKKDYEVKGEPEDLAGAVELAKQNRYQFQWWACSLIEAKPYGDRKKGSDTGIDGFLYFEDERDKIKKVIIQVKSGNVSVRDVRDLGHVIDRESAAIGVFITLDDPTKPMKTEAAAKGLYHSAHFKKDYPRIQLLTIKEILEGKHPNLPTTISTIKQAERRHGENLTLFK